MSHTPQLRQILAVRLVASRPDRLGHFYVEGLGFTSVTKAPISARELALLGLDGPAHRRTLAAGDEQLDLDHFGGTGRPYPQDRGAADQIFQHCAIVVSDAAEAYDRALKHGAVPISTQGPVRLPPSAGGVIAVKFRDPEGHPLEFLQFPKGASSRWNGVRPRVGPLGIDHTAISVADIETSVAFYQTHGLNLGPATLNHGDTQAALDGLAQPWVDVVPLLPGLRTPHLELLGYRRPMGRPISSNQLDDVATTRIAWACDQDALLRDPDGHWHQLQREI